MGHAAFYEVHVESSPLPTSTIRTDFPQDFDSHPIQLLGSRNFDNPPRELRPKASALIFILDQYRQLSETTRRSYARRGQNDGRRVSQG
jgi:hypothetical protein